LGQAGQFIDRCIEYSVGNQKLSYYFHVQRGGMSRKTNWIMACAACLSPYAYRSTFPGCKIERRKESIDYPSNNLATPNAAPAAAAPINITLIAPHQGCTPVILLLNQPKTKRHKSVTNTEIFNPSPGESTKK
jgi:hypothetical protein